MNNKVLNARQILLSTVLFSSAAGLVFFGNAAVEGAKNGMVLCADLLVPSIFPFMCLCSLICASGGGELVSKITRVPFGFFFPGLSDFSYIYIIYPQKQKVKNFLALIYKSAHYGKDHIHNLQ